LFFEANGKVLPELTAGIAVLYETSETILVKSRRFVHIGFHASLQADLIDEIFGHFGSHHALQVSLDLLV
jgi:hypothetical protein